MIKQNKLSKNTPEPSRHPYQASRMLPLSLRHGKQKARCFAATALNICAPYPTSSFILPWPILRMGMPNTNFKYNFERSDQRQKKDGRNARPGCLYMSKREESANPPNHHPKTASRCRLCCRLCRCPGRSGCRTPFAHLVVGERAGGHRLRIETVWCHSSVLAHHVLHFCHVFLLSFLVCKQISKAPPTALIWNLPKFSKNLPKFFRKLPKIFFRAFLKVIANVRKIEIADGTRGMKKPCQHRHDADRATQKIIEINKRMSSLDPSGRQAAHDGKGND